MRSFSFAMDMRNDIMIDPKLLLNSVDRGECRIKKGL
jgi:hypothetical protein